MPNTCINLHTITLLISNLIPIFNYNYRTRRNNQAKYNHRKLADGVFNLSAIMEEKRKLIGEGEPKFFNIGQGSPLHLEYGAKIHL